MTDGLDLRPLDREHEPDPAFQAALRARIVQTLTQSHPSAVDPTAPGTEPTVLLLDEEPTTTTTGPTRRRRRRPALIWGAAAAAVVAIVAAVALLGAGGDDDVDVAGPPPALFDDGFDDDSGGWLEGFDTGVRVTTGGGAQVWEIPAAGQTAVQRPAALRDPLGDVEVAVRVASISDGSSIAVLCRKGGSTAEDPAYAFRIGPRGASIEAPGTGRGTLAEDPAVSVPRGPFTLRGSCVDVGGEARLELSLDGVVALSAIDPQPLAPGRAGIEVQSGDPGAEVVLDRFLVDRAP